MITPKGCRDHDYNDKVDLTSFFHAWFDNYKSLGLNPVPSCIPLNHRAGGRPRSLSLDILDIKLVYQH